VSSATDSFYERWLQLRGQAEAEKRQARKAISPDELEWVTTRQDARAALLISPENGFRTWGTTLMVAEIPVGWQTGEHLHGEEAVFIHRGRGCSVIDGRRFDWEAGDCLWIPFGSRHQHFNLGAEPVQYVSALCPDLEYQCLVVDVQQLSECGPCVAVPDGEDGGDVDADGRQLVFRLKNAPATAPRGLPPDATANTAFRQSMPAVMSTAAVGLPPERQSIHLMYPPRFVGEEVELTHIFTYGAGDSSPKHAHMEAMLYVVKGRGYSVIDDERFDWQEGSAFHVQGPQTVHQFFATEPSRLLRIHFGIRSLFFQPIAKPRFPYVFLGGEEERNAGG
jgi:mannose-6-phosphate isomerase-like protein (cupin superfamily)